MAKKYIHPLHVEFRSVLDHLQIGSTSRKKQKSKQTQVEKNERALRTEKPVQGFIFVLGLDDQNLLQSILEKHAAAWQLPSLRQQTLKETTREAAREVIHFSGVNGPVWIFARKKNKGASTHHARLDDSDYAWHRDQVGMVANFLKAYGLQKMALHLQATDEEQELGIFVGLDLAFYSYKALLEEAEPQNFPLIQVEKTGDLFDQEILQKAKAISVATNMARHFVNTPPNYLNPQSFAQFIQRHFRRAKNLRIEIWNEQRLRKENMGLLLGVGQGAEFPPCLIHIRYRKNQRQKPIAFVGKGVTFDTGGLDIKPSSNMRSMKKDMGGVAALTGLAQWLATGNCPVNCDLYLGLAENSVDAKSMRPSDVLTARNGMRVEIHNTDAEGRLVMADLLDLAVSQKGPNEPQMVIDVATLTGAIKVALGADIAGLFSNHDGLAEELNQAGAKMGEFNWRMPLFAKYPIGTETPFADVVNCVDGFGGAITAALFLEKFVQKKPWAHLDIYAWNDRAKGALTSIGGSGQGVQTLIQFLKEKARS